MQNIIEIMKANGIEVSDDQGKKVQKSLLENYVTKNELAKKVQAAESDRDEYKQKYERAEETLKSFEGVDVNDLTGRIKEYEGKIAELEETHKQELYARDFADALDAETKDIKFSSDYAKKSVMEEIKAAGLKMVDGKIIGLNDMIASIREKDKSAFVDEKQEQLESEKPKFTDTMSSSVGDDTARIASIRQAMGLPEEGSK
ncbi:MAG: phage scaffolding protein [Roseburia sp.]|nr:phage scaffolding protein [Roseburia sp.]